jgi:hypothetical protein
MGITQRHIRLWVLPPILEKVLAGMRASRAIQPHSELRRPGNPDWVVDSTTSGAHVEVFVLTHNCRQLVVSILPNELERVSRSIDEITTHNLSRKTTVVRLALKHPPEPIEFRFHHVVQVLSMSGFSFAARTARMMNSHRRCREDPT